MTSFTHNDLAFHDAQALRNLAVEQSQLLVVATQVIKKLEKLVETLTVELGAKHQKTLFAAENLEKMRHLHFGRSSERHENDDNSPLFSLFTQLSQHASPEDDSSKPESKPTPI